MASRAASPSHPATRPDARVDSSRSRRTSGANVIEYQERLRSLALSDDHFVGSVLGMSQDTVEVSRLDSKTHALVRLAALLAVDAGQSSYNASVEVALASGASLDEIVGILIAVAPAVGLGRVVSAAPELGLALGYDVNAALEAQD
jgi:alkylhydroperoxidase/carboxymuconolactone decarboxylase family protein YurZ